MADQRLFLPRLLATVGVAAVVFVAGLVLWHSAHVLLLLFAGILLAIALRAPANAIARRTPLAAGWALALVVLFVTTVFSLIVWFYGPQILKGVHELVQNLPKALRTIQSHLEEYEWGQALFDTFQRISWDTVSSEMIERVIGIFSTALPAIGSLLIIVFLGVYLSAEPNVYINGVLRLIPIPKRARAAGVLRQLGHVLKWFLLSRLASMLILGALTWLGLSLLGVPSALPLALLAAILEFVPNIGPVVAAVPAALVAFAQSPTLALWVILFYVALQTIESYVITPLLERKMISVPPAWLFVVQVTMGLYFGLLGLFLAAPMAAALIVVTRMVYIEDMLGDRTLPG